MRKPAPSESLNTSGCRSRCSQVRQHRVTHRPANPLDQSPIHQHRQQQRHEDPPIFSRQRTHQVTEHEKNHAKVENLKKLQACQSDPQKKLHVSQTRKHRSTCLANSRSRCTSISKKRCRYVCTRHGPRLKIRTWGLMLCLDQDNRLWTLGPEHTFSLKKPGRSARKRLVPTGG